jgi:hypothetical protein
MACESQQIIIIIIIMAIKISIIKSYFAGSKEKLK